MNSFPSNRAATGRAHDLRVGVHLGDVAVGADGDLYGDGVNAAARIQEAAEPGQVLLSQDVWRLLRSRSEFRFQSLGGRALKGVGTIELYAVNVVAGPAESRAPGVTETHPSTGQKPIRSVAVLPFVDLSPERDQEYFSDGVAEEILNGLTKVSGLRVPARTSCFAFRGENVDAREIGNRLGVEALLEGSIRKAGTQLRITVQLVDAQNGYRLWSERFDRELDDIFAVQDEIAQHVVDALGLSRSRPQESQLVKCSTKNVPAYEFYLRGRKLFQKWTRQNIELARQMFQRAIELDPGFAGAWAGLAGTHVHLFGCDNEPHLKKARDASARALKLDPELAEAHVAAGQGFSMEKRYDDAARAFERAIELDPTFFEAYYYYGRACFKSGELEKSLRLFQKAQSVRPENYEAIYLSGLVLRQLGRNEESGRVDERASKSIRKHLELNPDDARAYGLGAGALARLGESEQARQWCQRAMSLAPDDDAILYNSACALAQLGEDQRALDALQRAIDAGLAGSDWVARDPAWERLRTHARFQMLASQLATS